MLPPVLLLTAGLGTRLRPLSSLRAKAAMPVAGTPLVIRILRWLTRSGAREVILNLHHRPETITAIVGDGSACGLAVRYSWEQPILGSGGGPRRAFALIPGDDLLIVNGDTLTDVDLPALWQAHRSSGALVTMALIENPRPDQYGGVRVEDGVVTGFTRRGGMPPGLHFIGVQCARREAFAAAGDGVPSETVGRLYPALMRERPGAVRGWTTSAAFDDVGTPWTYLEMCLARAAAEGAPLVDPSAVVAPTARVERSVVWPGARVEAGAELVETIVAGDVVVPLGSRYHRAVIVPVRTVAAAPGDRIEGDRLIVPMAGKER